MIKLGILMDPICSIDIKKDTSFAILLEFQKRGHSIHYMEMNSIYLCNGIAKATIFLLSVINNDTVWYSFNEQKTINLSDLDVILIRKDPPFDTEFMYATYILERAENCGVLVINKPQSLRDCNEKIFISWFSSHTPNTLVSRDSNKIRNFLKKNSDIILKPLDGMQGNSIFRIQNNDPNVSVIIEMMTNYNNKYCMAQAYLPEIIKGDKRILVVDGEIIPYCLARIPKLGETRGNLAAGGHGIPKKLSDDDWKIARDIAPILKKKGLMFVGLDIIGDKLTEINVTSPTCVLEIEKVFPISIIGIFVDAIEKCLINMKK